MTEWLYRTHRRACGGQARALTCSVSLASPARDGLGIDAAEGGAAVGGAYPLAAARSSAWAAADQVDVHLDVVSGHLR